MRNFKVLFFFLSLLSSIAVISQPTFVIEDQSVCEDTFTVDVILEFTGTITSTDFGVFWDGSEVEFIDSTILVPTTLAFVNEIQDSLQFSLTLNPTLVTNDIPLVSLRFRRLSPMLTSTDIRFKDRFPFPIVGDGGFMSLMAGTDDGTVSFEVFQYDNCPSDILVSNDPGDCGAIVNWTPPTLNDCDGTGIETLPMQSPGDFFDVGTTTITYSATNGGGTTTMCSFDITVNDTEDPTIDCPMDITVDGDLFGQAVVNGIAPISPSDNCPGEDITYTISSPTMTSGDDDASGTTFNEGTSTVTYTIEDASGNTNDCSFNVTVTNEPDTAKIRVVSTQPSIECDDDQLTFDVIVDDPVVLTSLQFSIDWDETKLQLTSASPLPGPNPSGTTYSGINVGGTADIPGQMGYIFFDVSSFLFTDDYVLFSLTFDVLDNTSTTIGCSSVNPLAPQAADVNGVPIPYDCSSFMVDYGADNTPPTVASCPSDITVFADDDCMAIATWSDPLFNDNCDGDNLMGTLVVGSASGSSFNEGVTAIRYEYTDMGGNGPAVCAFTVTVLDTISPEVTCRDTSIYLDGSGSYTPNEADLVITGTDNCPEPYTYSFSPSVLNCNNLGNTAVTVTIMDSNGNTSDCISNVTLLDTIDPMMVCQNVTVFLDNSGNISISGSDMDNGSTDNCGIDNLQLSQSNFDCSDIGLPIPVTLTGFDASGNSSSCLAGVTVLDTVSPEIVCPGNVSISTPNMTQIVTGIAPVSFSDNCPNTDITYEITGVTSGSGNDDASGTAFNIGVSTVEYTITDDSGNTDTCSFTVEIIENVDDPFLDCPDILRDYSTAPGRCDTTIFDIDPFLFTPMGVTVDSVLYRSFGSTILSGNDDASGSTFNTGSTTVRYIAFFSNGFADSCEFTITVNDDEFPVIIEDVNDTTLYVGNRDCIVDFTWMDPVVSENCPGVQIEILGRSNNPQGLFSIGMDTIRYEITDEGGNTINTEFVITVLDTFPPSIVCPPDTTIIVDPGVTDTIVNDITWLFSNDNCMIDNRYYSLTGATNFNSPIGDSVDASGQRFNFGLTTVTYYITDDSGNIDSCKFNVDIRSFIFPNFDCPSDTVLYAGEDCLSDSVDLLAIADPAEFDSIYHVISGATTAQDSGFVYDQEFGLGVSEVEYFFEINGEVDSCSFMVTVLDTLAPELVCAVSGDTTILVPMSVSDTLVNDIGLSSLDDNCGIDGSYYVLSGATSINSDTTLSADASGERFNLGTTTVTYYAYDASGNADSCSFDVIITQEDIMLVCPPDTTMYTNQDNCVASSNQLSPNSNTARTITGVTAILSGAVQDTLTSFANAYPFPLGNTNVKYTVAYDLDTVMCEFNVSVLDTFPPYVVCDRDTILVYEGILSSYEYSGYTSSASDSCGLDTSYIHVINGMGVAVSYGFGDTLDLMNGPNTIRLFAQDGSGNIDSCDQQVEVLSYECPDNAVFNSIPGLCAGELTNVDFAFDPDSLVGDIYYEVSGDSTYTVSEPGISETASGDTLNVGFYELTYYMVTALGDTFSCSSLIRVLDVEAPVFIDCPSDTVQVISELETCQAIFNYPTPVATDNCGIDTIFANVAIGDTLDAGFHVIEYIALDVNGLRDTCSFTLEVVERRFEIECPDEVIIVDVYGNVVSDFSGLVDSTTVVDCEGIQLHLGNPQAYLDCQDTIALFSPMSAYMSGDTFPLGASTVTYFLSDGNETISCEVRFNVIRPDGPSIVEDTVTVCAGESIVLHSQVSPDDTISYTYTWTFEGDVIGSDDSLIVNNLEVSGNGYYYLSNGTELGCSYIDSALVVVNPLPDVSIESNFNGCLALGDSLSICLSNNDTSQMISSTLTLGDSTLLNFVGDTCYNVASIDSSHLGLYIFSVVNQYGCSSEASIQIDTSAMLDMPILSSSDTTICAGDQISIGVQEYGIEGIEYVWIADTLTSGLPDSTNFNSFEGIVPTGDTVVYQVFVRNGECQSDTASLAIYVLPVPQVDISSNSPLFCVDDSDTLFLNSMTMDTLLTYQWSGPHGFTSSAADTFITNLADTMSGTYILTSTGENGCTDVDVLPVFISENFPAPSIFGPQVICYGESFELSTTDFGPAYVYMWSSDDPNAGIPMDSDTSSITVTPTTDSSSVTYQLVVLVEDCVADTATFTVRINSLPEVSLVSNAPFFCIMGDTTLIIEDTARMGVSYVWTTPSGEIFDDTSFIQIDSVNLEDAGIYQVQVLGDNGCVTFDSIDIIIDTIAPTPIIVGDTVYCENDTIMLSVLNPVASASYSWTGPNDFTDMGNPITILDAKVSNVGAYTVTTTIEGCGSATSAPFNILDVITAPAISDTTYNVFQDSFTTNTVVIDNLSNTNYEVTVLGGPSNGVISGIAIDQNGVILTYTPSTGFVGTDIVSLEVCVSDCNFCTTISVNYIVEPLEVECIVNNVITPDGDGINETVEIDCLEFGEFPENEMIIFNQWGDEIYKASPYIYNQGWDGTYEGEPVPDGTYFYIFRESSTSPIKKGFITVFR